MIHINLEMLRNVHKLHHDFRQKGTDSWKRADSYNIIESSIHKTTIEGRGRRLKLPKLCVT